jgi:hypothetical protein
LFFICVGTGTETGVKSENHELEHILDSVDELLLDIEFIDELNFDGDTIGTNPADLDDLTST